MNHEKLIIDWTQSITYNTIMALLVGVSLISIANIGKNLLKKENINPTGWSLNLAVLGLILSVTGLHMTLTWPLAKYFPFDNIIFGEPTLAFGVLNLVLSFYIWKHRNEILKQENPLKYVANHLKVFKILFYALGLMLTSIFFCRCRFSIFCSAKRRTYFRIFCRLSVAGSLGIITGVSRSGNCFCINGKIYRESSKRNL